MFADDTAIMTIGDNAAEASEKLQTVVTQVHDWMEKWRVTINEFKSTHINFTNRNIEYVPIRLNRLEVPYVNTAKYLGMTLDTKLRWKAHVKKKREELNLKYRKTGLSEETLSLQHTTNSCCINKF
jgi:hypothetical protein